MSIVPLVNNLHGHGFWQFCSDLLYEIYSEKNGFIDTEVFYASSLDSRFWYQAPLPQKGVRVEIASIAPVILLCVSKKIAEVPDLNVHQPYYATAWDENTSNARQALDKSNGFLRTRIKPVLKHYPAKLPKTVSTTSAL